MFAWALKRNIVISNAFAVVDKFPTKDPEPRPLSPVELERLFKANPPGSKWYPFLMTYMLTGARLSEILMPKFSWADIDFENERFRLPIRKGNKSSEFPLDEVLLEIFRELKQNPYEKYNTKDAKADSQYPFPFTPDYISHKISRLMAEAGIDASTHDLRDSFVSHLIYLGFNLEDVSKLAGHSSIKVTEQHYFKQLEDRRREMLSSLGEHIQDAAKTLTKNADNEGSRVVDPDTLSDTAIDDLLSGPSRIRTWNRRIMSPAL